MYPGTTIHTPLNIYGDWFEREGDNLIVEFEIIKIQNLCQLDLEILTKSTDDVGNGTSVTSNQFLNLGRNELKAASATLKDLVRLRFECEDNLGTAGEPQWLHFRILNMIWYDTPNA